MKNLSFLKKSIYSGLVFFGTIIILSLVYAGVTNIFYSDLPNVGTGSGLTSMSWNNLVSYANKAVKQDTEVLTVTGGKVGIGTVNPQSTLDVNGTIGGSAFTWTTIGLSGSNSWTLYRYDWTSRYRNCI